MSKFKNIFSVSYEPTLKEIWGMRWTDFWKIHPGPLPNMDEFSRNQSQSPPGKLKFWENIWMSFPEFADMG